MSNKEVFLRAISDRQLVEVTYHAVKYKDVVTQTLVPLDYGPWRRSSSSDDIRYHFYSSSDCTGHPVSLRPEQIIALTKLDLKFRPEQIINWVPDWHIYRDWGAHS
jgi:hypothetical protein